MPAWKAYESAQTRGSPPHVSSQHREFPSNFLTSWTSITLSIKLISLWTLGSASGQGHNPADKIVT